MDKYFTHLYYLTGSFLVISILFVVLIGWVTHRLSAQQKYMELRDKQWGQRIEAVEALVRTEFQSVISELKKIIK